MNMKHRGKEMKNQGFRLPPELLERIKQSATKNRRSINSEAIILFEFALDMFSELVKK